MVVALNDINISSEVGEESLLSPYFPTIFSTGQKIVENTDTSVDIVTGSGVKTTVDTRTSNTLKTDLYTNNYDVYGDYTINLDLDYGSVTTAVYPTYSTNLYTRHIDTLTKFKVLEKVVWLNSLQISYYNNFNFNDTVNSLATVLKLYSGKVRYSNTLENNIYLSNIKTFGLYEDVYCTDIKLVGKLIYDVEVGKGRITNVSCDVYSSNVHITNLKSDVYATDIKILSLADDVRTTAGRILNIQNDVYSAAVSVIHMDTDIRLNSLHITNFSLDYDNYAYIGNYLYADMLEYMFDIDVSNSYIQIDGVITETTFSGISNGVRASCLINEDFISDNEIEVKVVASNTIGDTFFEFYYLLSGYSVELDTTLLFNYNKNILVHSCGTNAVECPNTECNSFIFTTSDYPSYDLSASISCVVSEDLSAEIVPQSTALFYGRSYRIIVSNIKDNSGNYSDPVVLEFTIEEG